MSVAEYERQREAARRLFDHNSGVVLGIFLLMVATVLFVRMVKQWAGNYVKTVIGRKATAETDKTNEKGQKGSGGCWRSGRGPGCCGNDVAHAGNGRWRSRKP